MWLLRLRPLAAFLLLFHASLTNAVALDVNSPDSIKKASKTIAENMMSLYTGDEPGGTPGLLPGWGTPEGYYWWVGGGMFATMVNYWYHTGDDTWNDVTKQAMVYQSAPELGGFFEPKLQQLQLGNDDIAFWAFAAMSAAEYKFPNPSSDVPGWLAMVQGVFNRQAYRWDNTCGGGLRWQVSFTAPGYQFKNSISNGCFFLLAARLGKYTGNTTYNDWAERTFDWMWKKQLIRDDYSVIDGLWIDQGCSWQNSTEQWTYNVGTMLYGSAALWNSTGSETWRTRTQGFLDAANLFFVQSNVTSKSVLTERICEPYNNCKLDQTTFKAYIARWMRATSRVAPWTKPQVDQMLAASVPAAAQVCNQPGGDGGVICGQEWYTGSYDDRPGIGPNMNAMEVIMTLLDVPGPVNHTTGISKGDPSAGAGGSIFIDGGSTEGTYVIHPTTADKAGAAIITILLAAGTLAGGWWILK